MTREHQALFNTVLALQDCEYTDTTTIKEFVEKVRYATHYSHIILDIDYFDDKEQDIISALYLLQATNKTPIILILQGHTSGDILLTSLINTGYYSIVLSLVPETATKELQDYINCPGTFEDMQKYLPITPTTKKEPFFNLGRLMKNPIKAKEKGSLSIGVVGIMPRIGTTTQAIRLCKALENACYIEENDNGHVAIIQTVFSQAQEVNDFISYAAVNMFVDVNSPMIENYEYMVFDCGTDLDTALTKDICIVVAGTTAWELAKLASHLDELFIDKVSFIYSFVDSKEKEDIGDFMGTKWQQTFFATYTPDMFADLSADEKPFYKKIIG